LKVYFVYPTTQPDRIFTILVDGSSVATAEIIPRGKREIENKKILINKYDDSMFIRTGTDIKTREEFLRVFGGSGAGLKVVESYFGPADERQKKIDYMIDKSEEKKTTDPFDKLMEEYKPYIIAGGLLIGLVSVAYLASKFK
jgi:hypothetical protein